MSALVALVAGALFGTGLLISGMTNPANVLAFLDVTGTWRVGLAFTMAAAIAVALPAYAAVRRRGITLRGAPLAPAGRSRLDGRLFLGSAIFGIGWGLGGVCPGPGVVLLAGGAARAFAFVAGVIVGALISGVALHHRPASTEGSGPRT